MPTLLIGFDQVLPKQDARRVLEALLPRSKPCSYVLWPATSRYSSNRVHRRTISRSESGWDTVWHQFISDWKGRPPGEPADLSSFLNDLPKLLNSSCYSDVAILGPAPRTALSSACARALRVALLSLKKARLIWVDLCPNQPKSATLSFSRMLLNSNSALVNPVLVRSHLKFFRPESLGVAPPNTLDIFKSTVVLSDGSQISVRAYNIKSKIEVRLAVDARPCRRALITADAELSSSACWFCLRKRHSYMSSLELNDMALIVQVGTLWGVLFPFSDMIFLLFNISTDVYENVISKLERFEPPIEENVKADQPEDHEFSFRGEMISDLVSKGCDSLIEADYDAVENYRDDVSERLEALRKAQNQESEKPSVPLKNPQASIDSLLSFFRQILMNQASVRDIPKRIRELLMHLNTTPEGSLDHVSGAENLEKALSSLRQEGLVDSIASVQLQIVVSLEIALLTNSCDPVSQETLDCLQRHAASLSVMFAGNGLKGLEEFLETVLVKFYASRFPLTLFELYDNLDLHPPCAISRPEDDESTQTLVLPESETFTDAATAGLPESPHSSSKNTVLSKKGSNLLELIAQESSKRRRTVSCFSSRLENTVKWNRSFCDRDPKRRRSDSNFFICTDSKSSSASRLHVLVEASPIRAPVTSRMGHKLDVCGVISESPLSASYSDTVKLDLGENVALETPTVKRILTFEDC